MNKVLLLVLAVCMVCESNPCRSNGLGRACLHYDTICYESVCGGPPVGAHSHPTYSVRHYTEEDLQFNRTRGDIRRWLKR